MPEPDCFLRYRIGYAEFYVGKIPCIRIGGAPLERAMVLKWFYSLSRRKTFVGGKCALLSALLVIIIIIIIIIKNECHSNIIVNRLQDCMMLIKVPYAFVLKLHVADALLSIDVL